MHQRTLTLKNKAGMDNLSGPGISCSAENSSNGFQVKLTRKARPKDGLKKSFLEKCSPVTMRDTGQRFREKRAFSEFP